MLNKLSSDSDEVSPGGAPLLRYQAPLSDPNEDPFEGEERIQALLAHFKSAFGTEGQVFHERVSDTVHIDVHLFTPPPGIPFYTLITAGMSRRPMNFPGQEQPLFAELMLLLPIDWQIDADSMAQDPWFWPIAELKFLARFPHLYSTYLVPGNTVPNGEPPEPFNASVPFTGWLVMPSRTFPKQFCEFETGNGETVHIFAITPLLTEEMDFKLEFGVSALFAKLDALEGFNECIQLQRSSALAN